MDKNLYDNIEENNPVRNLLRQMPEHKAPDNFEYNLMVRIQNKQFAPNVPEKNLNWFSFGLVPASVVALTVMIVFFVTGNTNTPEQLLVLDPPAANELAGNYVENSREVFENQFVHYRTFDFNQNKVVTDSMEVMTGYRLVIDDNDVINRVKINTPFDDRRSLSVDSYLSGDRAATNQAPATLVRGGAGQGRGFNFDGFFFRATDKALIELKARNDSISRMLREKPAN